MSGSRDDPTIDETMAPDDLGSQPTVAPDDFATQPTMGPPDGPAAAHYADETLDARPGPERIDRFELGDLLGAGGMGRVYAAHDRTLDRRVALKVLHTEDETPEQTLRVRREAQAMARLSHPNVCQIYEVGVHDGRTWIAMEHVDGTTLAGWQRTRRSWEEALAMYVQIGAGLAAAHGAGMLHRDFKPQNVLVGHDGRPRIIDFGLARAGDARPDATSPPAVPGSRGGLVDTTLTQVGSLVGTPAYMAPEQLDGRPLDARCDQFAFCIALYEALYSRAPFDRSSMAALVRSTAEGPSPPPPRSDVPPSIERAVLRGLSPDPDARWPSMAALLDALGFDFARDRTIGLRGRVVAFAVLATVAAVACGLMIYAFHDETPVWWRILVLHSAVFVAALIFIWLTRADALSTPHNRRMTSTYLTILATPTATRLLSWLEGQAVEATLSTELAAMTMVAVLGGLVVSPWIFLTAGSLLVGAVAVALGPGNPMVWYAAAIMLSVIATAAGNLIEASMAGVRVAPELTGLTRRSSITLPEATRPPDPG